MVNIEKVAKHYMVCALWSSVDDDGEPLDAVYSLDDIAYDTKAEMLDDCRAFCESNAEPLESSGLTDEQIGHDFWLTRNHHGAGFWDRGIGDIGKQLTDMAHPFGGVDLYVGDDGNIHQA